MKLLFYHYQSLFHVGGTMNRCHTARRIMVTLLSITFVLVLAGCNGSNDSSDDSNASNDSTDDNKPAPSYRTRHAIARIGGSKVILFGGTTDDTDLLNDTWQYDTSTHTWEEIIVEGEVPGGRTQHAMAYAGSNRIILFGGNFADTGYMGDTWEYDGVKQTWTELSISGPLPSSTAAMAYIGGSKIILFGGAGQMGITEGTYVFDADTHTWTQYNTTGTKPSNRWLAKMAYAGDNKVVLFGGIHETMINDRSIFLNDTWEYDLQTFTWTEHATTGTIPVNRSSHAMAYAGENKVILQGGFSGFPFEGVQQINYGDTWMYDTLTHTWTEYTTDNPGVFLIHAMSYTADNKVVMNGMGVTWEFDLTDKTWKEY